MYRLAGWLTAVLCMRVTMIGDDAPQKEAPPRAPMDEAPVPAPLPAYAEDHVLIAPTLGEDLERIARSYGAAVLRAPGPAGYGAVGLPPEADRDGWLATLRRDPRVASAIKDGITYGTGTPVPDLRQSPPRPGRAKWHLVASNPPAASDLRGVVVAVLDTGVAYEDREQGGTTWRRAPSLSHVRFVAPWDFINNDAHPNDDHQHGTHLASLIAAEGEYPGIAPNVSLMPIKVLDHQNVGTELALIDGIAHAVAHGADVINMSLSFGPGYVPSRALVSALEQASAAGAVLVGAAGNDGGDYVSQPAANPLVIAVGANRPEGVEVYGPAPYSNKSPRVDLMAPGGSVDEDRDGDGLLDGVIGETIALGDPSRTGFWLYAGTSQATALVSGAAAHLVAAGYGADEIRVLLQGSAASERYIHAPWVDGRGRGRLDVAGALALGRSALGPRPRELSAAVLGWLAPGPAPDTLRAAARVTILDEHLVPVPAVQVVGMFTGNGDAPFSCVTDADGMCAVTGPIAPSAEAPAWMVSVEDVVVDGASHHPRTALFAGDGLQALVETLRAAPELDGAVPMFRWRAQEDPDLGPIAPSLLLPNLGSGVATSPSALVMSPAALNAALPCVSGNFEIEGGGLASGRLAVRAKEAKRCEEGPTSYEIVQFPSNGLTAVVIDATGLADSPLALSAVATLSGLGGPHRAPELQPVEVTTGIQGDAIARNAARGTFLAGTPLGELLDAGGWMAPGGEPAANALAASPELKVETTRHGRLAGSTR